MYYLKERQTLSG